MSADIRILDDLKAAPEGARCAIMIRHSDRDGSLVKLCPDEVSLNAAGEERARRLGIEIEPRPIERLLCSPAVRCVRTCECIEEAHGGSAMVQPSRFLGMDGPFVLRPKEAAALMTSLGFVPFVEAYLRGDLDKSVLMPCADGTSRLLSWMSCRMRSAPKGVSVAVTHDLVLTPMLVHLFDYDVRGKGLIGFLDGFVLFERGHSLVARHDGKEVDVTSIASSDYD